jgi:hypothetical protein
MFPRDGLHALAERPVGGDERTPPHNGTRRGFGASGYTRRWNARRRGCGVGRSEAAGTRSQDEEA